MHRYSSPNYMRMSLTTLPIIFWKKKIHRSCHELYLDSDNILWDRRAGCNTDGLIGRQEKKNLQWFEISQWEGTISELALRIVLWSKEMKPHTVRMGQVKGAPPNLNESAHHAARRITDHLATGQCDVGSTIRTLIPRRVSLLSTSTWLGWSTPSHIVNLKDLWL